MSDPSSNVADRVSEYKARARGWPAWKKRDAGWLLTALGALIAAALFLNPSLAGSDWRGRLAAFLLICAATLLLAMVIQALKLATRALDKLRAFDELCLALEQTERERDAARGAVLRYASIWTPYEIDRVMLHKESYYIAVRRKRGRVLPAGTVFAVIDMTDGSIMGRFRTSDVRKLEYHAVAEEESTQFGLATFVVPGSPNVRPRR